MLHTTQIPDRFFEHGQPFVTTYMDDQGEGLAYKNDPEMDYELRAAFGDEYAGWSVVSLLGPYVLGWDRLDADAPQVELVSVDLAAQTVTYRTKERS